MKIYYAPNTRAVRIVWLFEELGLPYDLERFKLGDAAMRAPDYLKVHPMGRVPALKDGDVTVFESGAIVQYVLRSTVTVASFRTSPLPTSRPICNGYTMQKA